MQIFSMQIRSVPVVVFLYDTVLISLLQSLRRLTFNDRLTDRSVVWTVRWMEGGMDKCVCVLGVAEEWTGGQIE